MPFDALILSLAVVCVFVLFAGVLAWVDHTTSAWQRTKNKEVAKSAKAQPGRKAA
jgi:cytoskeletal protein RodZ